MHTVTPVRAAPFAFGVLACAFLAVHVTALYALESVRARTADVSRRLRPLAALIGRMEAVETAKRADVGRIARIEDPVGRAELLRLVDERAGAELAAAAVEGRTITERVVFTPFADPIAERWGDLWGAFDEALAATRGIIQRAVQAPASVPADAPALVEANLAAALRNLARAVDRRIDAELAYVEGQGRAASTFGLAGAALLTLTALAAAVLLARALSPLTRLAAAVDAAARGDFEAPVPGTATAGEIGAVARRFEALRDAVRERDRRLAARAHTLEATNRELDAAGRRLELVLGELPTAVIVADAAGIVTIANAAARRVVGDVRGRPAAEAADDMGPLLARSAAAEGPFAGLRGGRRWEWRVVTPAARTADAVTLLTGEDVTERIAAEDRALRSRRLAAAGELAARITHEVRNPLAAVRMNTEYVRDELAERDDALPLAAVLDRVLGEVDRLTDVTGRYLGLVRRGDRTRTRTDLCDTARRALDLNAPAFAAAGVTVEPPPADAVLWVEGDAADLGQITANLLRNALEAVQAVAGPRRVAVRADVDTAAVHLTVLDTGVGVTPAAAAALFEPFVSTKPGGVGIGLALSAEIAAAHGGTLDLVPAADGFATAFRLTLPRADRAALESGAPGGA